MAVFYLVFSFLDTLLLGVGDVIDEHNKIFMCTNGWYLLPKNNGGAVYLLIDGVIFCMFSFNMLHIFFRIPNNYGLLIKPRNNTSDELFLTKMTLT
jgi:hypothetical protein